MRKKIIIYGAGNRGKNLCEFLMEDSDFQILYIVDGDPGKWGEKLCGRFVIKAPETICDVGEAHICITVHNSRGFQDVRKKLETEYLFDMSWEIEYEELVWSMLEKCVSKHNFMLSQKEEHIIFDSYMGLGLGGIEAWTKDIVLELLGSGWKNIHILSDQHKYDLPDCLVPVVDQVERIEKNGTEDGVENYRNLVDYFFRRSPCKIVTSRPNVELMAACTVKKKYPDKVKVISVIHMGTQDTYRRYAVFREYVDLYIGVSQDIKMGMIEQGIPENKVTSMSCPFFCQDVLKRSYTTDRKLPVRIGYAGRLDSIIPVQKRMDLLLNLVEEMVCRGIKFKLEIAGDGPAREMMENDLKDKNLEENVFFLGSLDREKIADFWRRQDICVNLADFEGRSISIIEAMGNGAVPVVTLTSGVREDIENEKNGYYVPLGDYQSMADRIEYLEKNRMCIQIMGLAAHDAVYPKSLMSSHVKFWKKVFC